MEIIVDKNIQNNINNSQVRWYLSSQKIWIGKEENYKEVEESIEKSYGSFNWLYSDGDTLLFDRKNLIFTTAVIKIIEPINVIEEGLELINDYMQSGNIKLLEEKYSDYQIGECTNYYFKEDVLVSYDSNFQLKGTVLVNITDDFAFIIKDNELVGWVLRNSSKHIVTDEICCIDSEVSISDYSKEILFKYLMLLKHLDEDLVDDEEEKLKNDFRVLHDSIRTCIETPVVAIEKNILNVLDFMTV